MVVVNGVDVDSLREALRVVEEQSRDVEKRRMMNVRRARAFWSGGLRSGVRAGAGRFDVDENIGPERGSTPTSVEYVLGALGACVVVGFVFLATLRGVNIHDLEVALEGEIDNMNVFLALSDEGHSGFRRISLTAYVRADADEDTIKQLFDEAVRRSPIVNTLIHSVEVVPSVRVFS